MGYVTHPSPGDVALLEGEDEGLELGKLGSGRTCPPPIVLTRVLTRLKLLLPSVPTSNLVATLLPGKLFSDARVWVTIVM